MISGRVSQISTESTRKGAPSTIIGSGGQRVPRLDMNGTTMPQARATVELRPDAWIAIQLIFKFLSKISRIGSALMRLVYDRNLFCFCFCKLLSVKFTFCCNRKTLTEMEQKQKRTENWSETFWSMILVAA